MEAIAEWLVRELKDLEKTGKPEESNFEDTHTIYTKVIHALSDDITKTCAESGTLLRRVWNDYYEMVRERVDKAYAFARSRDSQVSQIAASILAKYEKKVKENEDKFREMRTQIEDYEKLLDEYKKRLTIVRIENESLRQKQQTLSDENARIQNENYELKEINRVMRSYFSNMKSEGKAGTV